MIGKKKTINLKMKILKIALKDAYRKGLILRDIELAIKHLPQDDSDNRGAFTMDEIERLKRDTSCCHFVLSV